MNTSQDPNDLPSQTKTRQELIDSLFFEDIPISFFDSLSMKFLASATKQSVRELYHPHPTPAITYDTPISDHEGGAAPPALAVQEVVKLVNSLRPALPESFVAPPTRFGTGCLSADDLKFCRNYRMDSRERTSIETVLEDLSEFVTTCKTPLSHREIGKALFIMAPERCIPIIEFLKHKQAPISEFYSQLQTTLGSRRSTEEFEAKVELLMRNDSNHSCLKVLDDLSILLFSSPGSTIDSDILALRESKRFLKNIGGETLLNSVLASLPPKGMYCYSDMVRVLKSGFTETLSDIHNRKIKVKHIETASAHPLNGPTSPTPNQPNRNVHQTGPTQPVDCFHCGSNRHSRTECDNITPSNPHRKYNNQPNLIPYYQRACCLHPRGRHNNDTCYIQVNNLCVVHGGHNQNDCRSTNPDIASRIIDSLGVRTPFRSGPPHSSGTYSHTFSNASRFHPNPNDPSVHSIRVLEDAMVRVLRMYPQP